MTNLETTWLERMKLANTVFLGRVDQKRLPVDRLPGQLAVITCMDPRVNLEALGITGFGPDGAGGASVRVIRTVGAMAEERSLFVGLYLAGIREIAVLMHTDCGCSLAYHKIGLMAERMREALGPGKAETFRVMIGEPFEEKLREWLKAFDNCGTAVRKEVRAIKALPFIPDDLVVHGLVYRLEDGQVDVVVNGYEERGAGGFA